MKIPLLDLKVQFAGIREEIMDAVGEVFDSQTFILGPRVSECEQAVAAYCGSPHAVGVSSGTDALLVALMSEGIGPGDEVITSPYSFFATAGSIARLGARPVFVDIDPVTFNIDISHLASRISNLTRAIIPVHLFGQCADMDPILDVARKHGLAVIEDAAQSIGADYKGRRAGSMGDYGCFSFFPSKNLGGAGDGGMVTTNHEPRSTRLRSLRNHGMDPKYYHKFIGGNFRLDALQAAVVSVKLKHLDEWTLARQRNAARYHRLFTEGGVVGTVTLPGMAEGFSVKGYQLSGMNAPDNRTHITDNQSPVTSNPFRHVFNQYVIRVPRRDEMLKHLQASGIGCEVYYPVPLHLQECFAYLGHKPGDFPESEKAARETLALPIYPELTDAQAGGVVDAIRRFYAG